MQQYNSGKVPIVLGYTNTDWTRKRYIMLAKIDNQV
jgi:hypothetical protein